MSGRLPVTPSPGPLESYAQAFDRLFSKRGQREGFRRYLEGLLLPSERNKTLTGLANTEPIKGAQHPQAQRLQWFLSESSWEPEEVNQRRLALLRQGPETQPDDQGVLVIDETGDRKWGNRTAHVGRQYLGSIGKIDNGVVSVSSLWANEQIYYPIDVAPYTPASWFARGKRDPQFQTKPEIALELVRRGRDLGIPFRAVVADSFYGDHLGFQEGLAELGIGYVLALKPSHSWWHREGDIGSVMEAAQVQGWEEQDPGHWVKVVRRFRDGHEEVWWVLEAQAGPYGPTKPQRLVIATTNPKELPEQSTWYLVTNLPAPNAPRTSRVELAPADLAEVVRLYGLRVWVEQSYKQVKQTLGWAQYQVRSSIAIRRHWQLVFCAFSFCWWAAGQSQEPALALGMDADQPFPVEDLGTEGIPRVVAGGKRRVSAKLASGPAPSTGMAGALLHAATLLARVVRQTPSSPITNAP